MARRKGKRRSKGKSTFKLVKGVLYTGAIVAPGYNFYKSTGDIAHTITRYGGIGTDDQFAWDHVKQMWLPVGALAALDWATSKIGLQRKVAAGINGLLG